MPGAVTTWFNDIAGAAGWAPNLSALPVNAQVSPKYTEYSALNVRSMAAGDSYDEPYSGVKVTKLTSRTYPVTNTAGWCMGYSGGGPRVSRPWGTSFDRYTIHVANRDGGNGRLIDFQYGGTILADQAAPSAIATSGFTTVVFSTHPDEPHILYFLDSSNQLRRWDTVAGDYDESAGRGTNFPVSVGSANKWLTIDGSGDWLVVFDDVGKVVWMYNITTDSKYSQSVPSTDECYVDKTGTFVWCNGSYNHQDDGRIIDLTTDPPTLGSALNLGANHHISHSAALRNAITGFDYQNGNRAYYRQGDGTEVIPSPNGIPYYAPSGHDNCSYLQPGGAENQQYYVRANHNESNFAFGQILLVRLDGGDTRSLGHHYSLKYAEGGDYYNQPWPNWSPDGCVVAIDSDTDASANGDPTDVYVYHVPRIAA